MDGLGAVDRGPDAGIALGKGGGASVGSYRVDRSQSGVRIRWDANATGITGTELTKLLDEGSPRIVMGGTGMRPDNMNSSVTIYCYIMTPAEVKIVADRIYTLPEESAPFSRTSVVPSGAPAAVDGSWAVTVHYLRGTGEQHFVLKQEANAPYGRTSRRDLQHHAERARSMLTRSRWSARCR